MTVSNYRVRRATLDDITQLTAIWKSMDFPVEELAKRITEFQVAESADGKVVGALGLQIAERQGRVHSEGFSDFAVANAEVEGRCGNARFARQGIRPFHGVRKAAHAKSLCARANFESDRHTAGGRYFRPRAGRGFPGDPQESTLNWQVSG